MEGFGLFCYSARILRITDSKGNQQTWVTWRVAMKMVFACVYISDVFDY